ncbi:MAG: alpha/beta hydrolase-fold protein [Bacteroidales bacterium]
MKKLILITILTILVSKSGNSQIDRIDTIAKISNWPEWWIGTVESSQFKSKYVNETYDISIYLPASYHHDLKKTYPILYLTDGFYTFGIAQNSADLFMCGNEMPEIIIIGIGFKGKNMVEIVRKRGRDFTSAKIDGFTGSGGAENFFSFISKELSPKIESKYRINKNDRALAGFSFGGQFAAYVFLNHTDFFNKYIIGSPSYIYDTNLIQTLKTNIGNLGQKKLVCYTFLGEKEPAFIELWKEFNNLIIENKTENLKFMSHMVSEKTHTSVFQSEFPVALQWIYNQ